jgi:hypothetical protein
MKKRRERGHVGALTLAFVLFFAAGFVAASQPAAPGQAQTGSLHVTILPQGAISAGARWRIAKEETWRTSGSWLHNLKNESVTIEFKEIYGWTRPASQNATIQAGQNVELTGIYVVIQQPQSGSLQVTLSPQQAANQGARWRPANTSAWKTSGSTQTNLNTGSATIEFKVITGWNAPPNQSVTITAGQTTTASATYTQQPGSIKANLQPAAAVSAGAQWRVVGTMEWHNSGYVLTGVMPGSYVIEFKDITGWRKPSNRTITVSANHTNTLTGTYLPPNQR